MDSATFICCGYCHGHSLYISDVSVFTKHTEVVAVDYFDLYDVFTFVNLLLCFNRRHFAYCEVMVVVINVSNHWLACVLVQDMCHVFVCAVWSFPHLLL